MIQAEELYRRIHEQKPFVPLRVHLSDGRSYDILHQQLAIVRKTFLIIGILASNQREPICDYTEVVNLADVSHVEALPVSAALAS